MRVVTQRIIVIASGLSACLAVVIIALQLLSSEITQAQRHIAHSTLNLTQSVIYDSLQSLDDLSHLDIEDCSDSALLKMRQVVFLSDYIKDAGFIQNERLVCTTTGGALASPMELAPPTFSTGLGFDLWLNQQLVVFDNLLSGVVLRKGDFNVVVNNNTFGNLEFGDNQWEIVNRYNNQITHLIGTPGIFKQAQLNEYEEANDNFHYFHRCSENYEFCVALSLYNYTLIRNKLAFLAFSLLFSFAFGIITSICSESLIRRHVSVGSRLRRGLKKGYFSYQIQPLVDLKTKRIIGGEVLARFEDQHGRLFPDEFIPEIRRLRLTWPFTQHIIETALHDLQASKVIQKDTKISFNIFPNDVESNQIAALNELVEVKQFDGNITLEITEDLQLDSLNANRNINHIIQQGFEVAIDDFGTGYSNLKQLKNFRCQYLKIDKSFVFELEAGAIRSSLVPHMVDIAHKSNLKVIAEGIENVMQSKALELLGVEYGQGWMFGKPMPIDVFIEKYLASQQDNKS
ncbi:EAL domain-containing protein [Agarivorans sp. MS3-6]